MRQIDPHRAEHMRQLALEDLRVGIDQPVHAIRLHQFIPVVAAAIP